MMPAHQCAISVKRALHDEILQNLVKRPVVLMSHILETLVDQRRYVTQALLIHSRASMYSRVAVLPRNTRKPGE